MTGHIRAKLAVFAATALLAALALPAAGRAAMPDWNAVADVETISALTRNEDGTSRETTIWLVVVDGQGYIRTSQSTTWGENVVRDPDIAVRIEGKEYPVHVTFIEDTALRERIVVAFREKYGWMDGFLDLFRGSEPRIMRLDPRSGP